MMHIIDKSTFQKILDKCGYLGDSDIRTYLMKIYKNLDYPLSGKPALKCEKILINDAFPFDSGKILKKKYYIIFEDVVRYDGFKFGNIGFDKDWNICSIPHGYDIESDV